MRVASGCDIGRHAFEVCLTAAVCQDAQPTCMVRMSKRPRNSFSEITIPKMVLYMSAEVPEYLQTPQVLIRCSACGITCVNAVYNLQSMTPSVGRPQCTCHGNMGRKSGRASPSVQESEDASPSSPESYLQTQTCHSR
jgi:hypothetical protein